MIAVVEATGPTEAQYSWVFAVLQIDLHPDNCVGAAARPARGRQLLPLWRAARESLDRQIADLRDAFNSFDDPDFQRIAAYGFNALTGGSSTALMAALFDYDAEPALPTAHRVQAAIGDYSVLLAPGSVLDDYDANPLGVTSKLRITLQAALDDLQSALNRHAVNQAAST